MTIKMLLALALAGCAAGPRPHPINAEVAPPPEHVVAAPEHIVAQSSQLEVVELASEPAHYLVRAPGGAFSLEVLAPTPKLQESTEGASKQTLVMFAEDDGTLGIGTHTSPLPADATPAAINAMFARAQASALHDLTVELTEEHDVTIAGAPAHVFDFSGTFQGLIVRGRMWNVFVAAARATVVVQVVGTEASADAKIAQAVAAMKTFSIATPSRRP
jgi:hypothetical protein